jgi:superoxide dismutase, Cu-Zn family
MIGILETFLVSSALAVWTPSTVPSARAAIQGKGGHGVSGKVEFAVMETELMLKISLEKLPPGRHGMHIHEVGNCEGHRAENAGDHYNPSRGKHGPPYGEVRHAGDLGNIEADKSGLLKTVISVPTPKGREFKGWRDVVGRSIVIHEHPDDQKTQPSGDVGAPIACGVILSTD